MAKNKTEIHVTTVFDGELDATDVFVSLISQKYGKTNTKEYLAKKKDLKYTVPTPVRPAVFLHACTSPQPAGGHGAV